VTDKVEATSTNGDLFVVPVSGGETKRITPSLVRRQSGVFAGWKVHRVPRATDCGYEADRWRVMLYDAQLEKREPDESSFDRNAANLKWSPDSKTIYFVAENETQMPVYAMAAKAGATPKK